jgi:hypothetical protein
MDDKRILLNTNTTVRECRLKGRKIFIVISLAMRLNQRKLLEIVINKHLYRNKQTLIT